MKEFAGPENQTCEHQDSSQDTLPAALNGPDVSHPCEKKQHNAFMNCFMNDP